eukprot:GEZU01016073.1.p1 GENE.GEZU01016073.1~~GEZU01016073.1.p1  ORF type:complete len:137 (-),score=11.55 GEZU01016073.1:132-500(-)
MSFADFDGANGGRKGGTTRYNTHDLESGPDYSSTAQRAQQPSNDRTSIRARELYNTIANNVKQLNKDMIAAKKSIDKLGTKKDNEEMRDKLCVAICVPFPAINLPSSLTSYIFTTETQALIL